MEYLRENMRDDQIFFVASQDEASYSCARFVQISASILLSKRYYSIFFILTAAQ